MGIAYCVCFVKKESKQASKQARKTSLSLLKCMKTLRKFSQNNVDFSMCQQATLSSCNDWKVVKMFGYRWSKQTVINISIKGFWLSVTWSYDCKTYSISFWLWSYLSSRQQRTKVSNTCSAFFDITIGVPQDSILGPLLSNISNIYICDIFYDIAYCNIAVYVDDNKPYWSNLYLDKVINKLGACTSKLFKWFHKNHIKANADKCYILVTTKSPSSGNIEEFVTNNSNEEKLLGIKVDTKFSSNNNS